MLIVDNIDVFMRKYRIIEYSKIVKQIQNIGFY